MSKVVMSLPKGMVKRSAVGGVIALAVYVALQFLAALLIHKEILGMEHLYPVVCAAAAVSSFLGCGYSVWKGRSAGMLTVSAVVAVFLTLTVCVALLSAQSVRMEGGLTGVGLAMAGGGLASTLVFGRAASGKKNRGGRAKKRRLA